MKYSHNQTQKSLFSLGLMQVNIPKDNELILMAGEIDWDAMIEIVGKKYSGKTGRNSKSLRMMIGLEIAKRKYGLSDKDIVEQLKVDVALKIFCGFNQWEHDLLEASSLTRFRARLDQDTLQQLEEVNIRKMIRKLPRRNRYQVMTDSTCVEANITYPTDTKLLSKTYEKLVQSAIQLRTKGKSFVIRGKLKVKKLIRGFNLKRKKSWEEYTKMNERLIRESIKIIRLIKSNRQINKTMNDIIERSEKILSQQSEMIKSKSRRISDRIISFHETEIRPIFRGKAGKQTEFGPKVALNVLGGSLVQTTKISNDNFSDTELVKAGLDTMNRTFGRDPTELIVDRGGHSLKNHDLLKERKITDGIQYRGKIPKKAKLPPSITAKRMYRQRSIVEGKIGTFKTRYGGRLNQYKNKNAQAWVSFGLITMNASIIAKM